MLVGEIPGNFCGPRAIGRPLAAREHDLDGLDGVGRRGSRVERGGQLWFLLAALHHAPEAVWGIAKGVHEERLRESAGRDVGESWWVYSGGAGGV